MIAEAAIAPTHSGLIEQHVPLAHAIAARLKRRYGWVDLDDLYSYSLLGLTTAARAWQPDRGLSFGAFARHKAMYVAVDEMRHDRLLRRESATGIRQILPSQGAGDSAPEWDPADPRASDALRDVDTRDMLGSVLRCLPPEDRHLLEMYYADGMTFEEIAQVVGVTQSTVCVRHKGLLARLRRLAQGLMKPNGGVQ